MYATAEQPWDRLCDQLNGGGVPNLDDALVNLELRQVHDALLKQLDPAIVRLLADVAEHPRAVAGRTNKKIELQRREFFELAWARCETLLHEAQMAYASRMAKESQPAIAAQPITPALLAPVLRPTDKGRSVGTQLFRERLTAVLRIPAIEALFPAPWTAAGRRVLPSPSPQFTATAMWAPVFGWCVLELLAESIDAENPEHLALDLFDRLRLREPFAQAFAALGIEAEEGWRVAARIKVLLLSEAGAGKPEGAPGEATRAIPETAQDKPTVGEERVAQAPALWLDPDVCWLSGVHESQGHAYLIREQYEELLWWLQLPSLLRLLGETAPSRAVIGQMSGSIEEALAIAESAGYRVDLLYGSATTEAAGEEPASVEDSGSRGSSSGSSDPVLND